MRMDVLRERSACRVGERSGCGVIVAAINANRRGEGKQPRGRALRAAKSDPPGRGRTGRVFRIGAGMDGGWRRSQAGCGGPQPAAIAMGREGRGKVQRWFVSDSADRLGASLPRLRGGWPRAKRAAGWGNCTDSIPAHFVRRPSPCGEGWSSLPGNDKGIKCSELLRSSSVYRRLGAGAGAKPRQGPLRHQLGGRGRAWRLLPGARGRHLQEIRPRRHHRPGRAEREQPHSALRGQDRLLHERQFAAIVRCGRAQYPHHRGGGELPEGPAGADRASRTWRSSPS